MLDVVGTEDRRGGWGRGLALRLYILEELILFVQLGAQLV